MGQRISHVPVFFDNAIHTDEFKMTRLTYFFVECSEPHDIILLQDLPILLIDLEGVIVSPLGRKKQFDTPESIIELFNYIDEKTPYIVSVGYIWLPNTLLKRYIKKKLSRKDVLRVYTPIFLAACSQIETSRDHNLYDIAPNVQGVYLSEQETLAFKAWTDRTVETVRKRYREHPMRNLRNKQERRDG